MTRLLAAFCAALTLLMAMPPEPVRAGNAGVFPMVIDQQQDPIFIPPGQLKKLHRQLMPGFAPGAPEPMPGEVMPEQGPVQAMPPRRLIPESMAVGQAMSAVPDGKPLGVRLLPGPRAVYAVRLRTATQVIRVIVDAETGEVLGQ